MIKKNVLFTEKFKQALKYGLILEKVRRAFKYNQKLGKKTVQRYELRARKNANDDFEKDFSKLINNAVFVKSMENVRKYETCDNGNKKELFNVRTKLSYNKFFFGTFFGPRNENNYGYL